MSAVKFYYRHKSAGQIIIEKLTLDGKNVAGVVVAEKTTITMGEQKDKFSHNREFLVGQEWKERTLFRHFSNTFAFYGHDIQAYSIKECDDDYQIVLPPNDGDMTIY